MLNFVCYAARLAIEIDGAHHDTSLAHDQTRDQVLAREGFQTLRIPARDALTNLEGVTTAIRQALSARPGQA